MADGAPPNPEKAARLAREATALRANLLKRKSQARERAKGSEGSAKPAPLSASPAPSPKRV